MARRVKTYAGLIKELDASRTRVGKERDKLRELVEDAEALLDTVDVAYEDLTAAIDALSGLA